MVSYFQKFLEENPGVSFDDSECSCIECGGKELVPQIEASGRTPWAVICRHCRTNDRPLMFLSSHVYNQQLLAANSLWMCPRCMRSASWNDSNHQLYLNMIEAKHSDIEYVE